MQGNLVVKVLGCLLLSCCAAFAGNLSPALKKLVVIEQGFLQLETIKGTFVKKIAEEGIVYEAHCKFYYQKPDKIRFDFLKPTLKTIISNGESVWVKTDGDFEKYDLATLPAAQRVSYGLVPGFGLDYLAPIPVTAYSFEMADQGARITATPKKAGSSHIEFLLGGAGDSLESIRYYLPEHKNSVTISFLDYKEVLRGVWLARSNSIEIVGPDGSRKEEVRFKNLRVNTNIDKFFVVK